MSESKKVKIPLTRYEWPDERIERKKKMRRRFLFALTLILTFSIGYSVRSVLSPTSPAVIQTEDDFARLKAVYDVMANDWYFGKDVVDLDSTLINDAILGMVDSAGDPHTSYMVADEVKAFTESIDRGFVGIGVSYFDSNGTYIVERVFIDSPADKAGVQPGDIIFKVDGKEVSGIGSDALVDLVRGEENTIVSIDFIRSDAEVHYDIPRGPINNTAYGMMLDDSTAYLEIYQFGSSTGIEVAQYLNVFKEANAKSLLIDMRDNGGGYLTSLEDIGSLLLEKDSILIQQDTIDGQRLVSKSTGNVVMTFDQIVILVNENTASAAEVLTAAIQENIGATVVGVTTYGKGTVQQQQPFSDGAALKYTVAEWLTPNGNKIHEVGITPDLVVEQHPVMSRPFTDLADDEAYEIDQVHSSIQDAQMALDFLDYTLDRQDGYFSSSTLDAIKAYQSEHSMDPNGLVSKELLDSLKSEVVRIWHIQNETKDYQRIEALKVIHG